MAPRRCRGSGSGVPQIDKGGSRNKAETNQNDRTNNGALAQRAEKRGSMPLPCGKGKHKTRDDAPLFGMPDTRKASEKWISPVIDWALTWTTSLQAPIPAVADGSSLSNGKKRVLEWGVASCRGRASGCRAAWGKRAAVAQWCGFDSRLALWVLRASGAKTSKRGQRQSQPAKKTAGNSDSLL